nr:RNA-directed DNA polymerase, eukaryota [Tanacetum cinerariifolium]
MPNISRSTINFQFPKRLSLEQVADLESAVTCDEVRNAVWSCGENKSPGSNGFAFEFFCKFWSIIGTDFCTAVEWFFQHHTFAKEAKCLNHFLRPPSTASSSAHLLPHNPPMDPLMGLLGFLLISHQELSQVIFPLPEQREL